MTIDKRRRIFKERGGTKGRHREKVDSWEGGREVERAGMAGAVAANGDNGQLAP